MTMEQEPRGRDEGLGHDPKMGEIVKSGGEGRNAGEVDPGVEPDELVGNTDESEAEGSSAPSSGASTS